MNKIILKRSSIDVACNLQMVAYCLACDCFGYETMLVKCSENGKDFYWNLHVRGDYNRDKLIRKAKRIHSNIFWSNPSDINHELEERFSNQRCFKMSVREYKKDCTGLPF